MIPIQTTLMKATLRPRHLHPQKLHRNTLVKKTIKMTIVTHLKSNNKRKKTMPLYKKVETQSIITVIDDVNRLNYREVKVAVRGKLRIVSLKTKNDIQLQYAYFMTYVPCSTIITT